MKNVVLSREKVNSFDRETLVELFLQLQNSFAIINNQLDKVQKQNEEQTKQVKLLQEKIDALTLNRFGKKSERNLTYDGQAYFDLETGEVIFNEIEQIVDESPSLPAEPAFEEITYKRKKSKGKRAESIKDITLIVEPCVELTSEELEELFPKGYNRLPDEVYTDVEYIPGRLEAHEHHYAVYSSKGSSRKVVRTSKTRKPQRLLDNSLLTSSLMAGIMNDKFVNHMPANRIHEDFARKGIDIPRQRIADWCIKISDRYLMLMYYKLQAELMRAQLIHSDETPFTCRHRDSTNDRSKDYMWVFHTDNRYGSPNIYFYHYPECGSRSTDSLADFLKDYSGILVTDGYQVYHSLEKRNPEKFTVAGCWVHARRPFATYIKSNSNNASNSIAATAIELIKIIFKTDKEAANKTDEERLKHRQEKVKPFVDAYFAWIKSTLNTNQFDKGSAMYKALVYSKNQEPFLRRFLDNPMIPLTNNDAEISIRSFCVAKHSWHVIDTESGSIASAMMYTLAETAKANNLKTFEYFKYLLDELVRHSGEDDTSYLDDLVPWSEKIPECCRRTK